MKIGLGLPIGAPEKLLTWARLADAGPFSTLGLLDRLVYDNPEPLVTLAAVAGATSRVRLQTEVLLAPLRDTPLLAKQAATLHRIGGGRFTLGLGVGDRDDDHLAAGRDRHTRGRRLDDQMATLHRIWSGAPYSDTVGPIGPAPTPRPPRGPHRPRGRLPLPSPLVPSARPRRRPLPSLRALSTWVGRRPVPNLWVLSTWVEPRGVAGLSALRRRRGRPPGRATGPPWGGPRCCSGRSRRRRWTG